MSGERSVFDGAGCLDAQIAEIARRTLHQALEPAGVRQRRMAGVSDPVGQQGPHRNRKE
jgi:hypothetical protein